MYVGNDEQRTQIHLMGAVGESPVARNAEEDPTRPHVALAVEDINEARRELEERGVGHWTVRSLVGRELRPGVRPGPVRQHHRAAPDRDLPLQSDFPPRLTARSQNRSTVAIRPVARASVRRRSTAWVRSRD